MRTPINILVFIFLSITATAQINVGGIPESWKNDFAQLNSIPVYATDTLNLKQLASEDEQDELDNVPPRFGYKHKVNLSVENSGVWTEFQAIILLRHL